MTNLNFVKVFHKDVLFNEFKFSNKEDMDKFLETDAITNLNNDYLIIVQYTRPDLISQRVYRPNTSKKETLKENQCNWLLEDYDYDLWKSECGIDWSMTNSEGPINNKMNFCPNCGGEITVVN